MDAGFFDQKLMEDLESLSVGYIIGGKLYEDIIEQAFSTPKDAWYKYRNNHQEWQYLEMANCRGTRKRYRRAILCLTGGEENQRVFDFARKGSIPVIPCQARKYRKGLILSAYEILILPAVLWLGYHLSHDMRPA